MLMDDHALTSFAMPTFEALDSSTPASPPRKGRTVSRLSGSSFTAEVAKSRNGAGRYRGTPLICQVAGCNRRLAREKEYYSRYRVCKHHSTQLQVQLTGSTEPHRFCQQCCAFQPLACFDGQRRSCRERLALHNARRKDRLEGRSEPGSDPASDAADSSAGGNSGDGGAGDAEGGASFGSPLLAEGKRRRIPAVHKLDMDFCSSEASRAASAAPRRKLSIRRATIETRAPVVGPTNNLKTRSRSFSDLADIFGSEAREHWLHPLQRGRLSPMRHPSLMDGTFMPGGGEGALLSSNNLMAVETNSAFPSLIGFGDSSGAADMQRLSLLTPAMPGDVAVAGAGPGVGLGSTERPQSLDTLLAEPPLQVDVPQSGTPTWLRPFHNDEFSPATGPDRAADSGMSMHDSAFSTDGHDDCGRLETSKMCSAAAPHDGMAASAAASLYAHWVHEPTSLAAIGSVKSAPPVLPLRKLAGSGGFGSSAACQPRPAVMATAMPLLDVAGSHGFRPVSSSGLSTADIHGMASSLIGTMTTQSPRGSAGDLSTFTTVKREPDLSMVPGLLHFQAASRHGFLKAEPDVCASPFDEGPPAKRSASGSLGSPLSNVTTWSPPALRPSCLSAEPMAAPFESMIVATGGSGAGLSAGFTPHTALRTRVS